MKLIVSILLIAALGFIAGIFLPWWSIAIVAFLVALLIPQHIGLGFLSGFLGIFIMWAIVATWIDIKNQGILSNKIAQLLPLGGSSVLLVLVTAIVGGLVGGFAAMAGSSLRPGRRVVKR
ncbi:MAG TPA: hypothetical protein VGC29_10555 [Flavisolibacter sp.]